MGQPAAIAIVPTKWPTAKNKKAQPYCKRSSTEPFLMQAVTASPAGNVHAHGYGHLMVMRPIGLGQLAKWLALIRD